jgi:Ca2+-binding RTX toxin-like protein
MRRTVVLLATMVLTLLVASGVAWAVNKVGTNGHDFLRGTNGSDNLVGRGGIDWIEGRGGNDVISGGPGNDHELRAGTMSAPIGSLNGGSGADVILGGPGHDLLSDGPWPGDSAVDVLEGGDGNDYLAAANRPAARDIVSCGAGKDTADVDRKDIVSDDCERERIRR